MFGTTGTEKIGGGHLIANFPTPVHGAAANFYNLANKGYVGMTISQAMRRWSGGYRSIPGPGGKSYDPNTRITEEMVRDPKFAVPFMQAISRGEAPGHYPMSDAQWHQAFSWYQAGKPGGGGGGDSGTQLAGAPPTGGGREGGTGGFTTGGIMRAISGGGAPPGTPAAAGGPGTGGNIATSIDEAMSMVGLHEVRDRQKLKEYMRTGGRSLSGADNAWCAAFVNAMVEHAGGTGTHSWAAKSFLKWGRAVSGKEELQQGDVFVFNRGRDPSKGHVGAFTGQTRTNARGETEYQIIQGNIGDKVATSWKTRAQIPYVRRGEFGDTQQATRGADSKSIQPTQKVEVNGSAKLNIDVNAPPGTKAKAEGAGLLKDINLKRTTQMQPADAAPAAPMQE
jgi:uncharacterized protein (TIGR02594 family)